MLAQNIEPVEVIHVAGVNLNDSSWHASLLLLLGLDGNTSTDWGGGGNAADWINNLANSISGLSVQALKFTANKKHSISELPMEEIAGHAICSIKEHKLLNRPLFICSYSYGGLIVKRIIADTEGHHHHEYFRRNMINLRGLVFLGVPHLGSHLATSILRRIIFPKTSYSVGDLSPSSRAIKDIDRRFRVKIAKISNLQLLSVRELRGPTIAEFHQVFDKFPPWIRNIEFPPVVSQSSATLNLPSEIIFDADATHRQLPKFLYRNSEQLLSRLKEILNSAVNLDSKSMETPEFFPETTADTPLRS